LNCTFTHYTQVRVFIHATQRAMRNDTALWHGSIQQVIYLLTEQVIVFDLNIRYLVSVDSSSNTLPYLQI